MLKRIALSILSIFIIAILLECYFRFFSSFRYYAPRVFSTSEYLPWALLANAKDEQYSYYGEFKTKISINKYGLRDSDFDIDEDRKKIIFLGDSFTYGFGVNNSEVYMKIAESKLNNKDLRLINCGFASGYSPDLYYLFIKHELGWLKPNFVIISIYPGNDLFDLKYNEWPDDDLKTLKIKCKKFYVDSNHRLRYGSEYGFAGKLFSSTKNADYLSKIKMFIRDNSYLFNFIISRIRMANFKKQKGVDFNIPESPISDALSRKRFEAVLSKTRAFLEQVKIGYLFILIPAKEDFSAPTNDFSYIENYLKTNKYDYLNLLPEFKGRNLSMAQLYYKYDGHWNRFGHYITGSIIADYLKKKYAF